MYGAGHLLSSHKEINEPAPFAIYLNSPYLTLLESVAGQKYHCPQMESLRNGLPQTAFRTDGTARTLLAVIGSETSKFPDIKNPLSAPVIFSATGSHRASSAVACPQAGSPIQECISVTGYLLFKVLRRDPKIPSLYNGHF